MWVNTVQEAGVDSPVYDVYIDGRPMFHHETPSTSRSRRHRRTRYAPDFASRHGLSDMEPGWTDHPGYWTEPWA